MINAKDEQIIAEVVNEKMQTGEQFTAYDVTLSAKRRGMGERHRDVRRKVHEQIQFQGTLFNYSETNINITEKGQDKGIARLYHPVGSDLSKYQRVADTRVAVPVDDSEDDDSDFDTDSGDTTRAYPRSTGSQGTRYDHAGRYSIKSRLVRDAELEQGDITISHDLSPEGHLYLVNSSGGIRLAQKRLVDAFTRLPPNIKVSVGDMTIVLTE